MKIMPKIDFDVSKIKEPYSLFAIFLIICQILLFLWLSIAENAAERTIAGIIMTIVFIAFLVGVVFMRRHETLNPIIIEDVGELKFEKKVPPEEVEPLSSKTVSSPDGSFTINRPPEGWIIQELNYSDWVTEIFQITATNMKEFYPEPLVESSEKILTLKSQKDTIIIPIPGKTTFDGRKYPTALAITIPIRLSIIPMTRFAGPLYVERPFYHNVLGLISSIFFRIQGLKTLNNITTGLVPNTKNRSMVVKFSQILENIIIDGEEVEKAVVHYSLIGIEGELKDHLLIVNSVSIPGKKDSRLMQDFEVIQSLVSTFRPLIVLNSEEKKAELKELGYKRSDELLGREGIFLFYNEFAHLLMRLSGWDMDDSNQRFQALNLLEPFEKMAKIMKIDDERLNSLWLSIEDVRKGNAADFKNILEMYCKTLEEDPSSLKSN